jgi:hypothetical protein
MPSETAIALARSVIDGVDDAVSPLLDCLLEERGTLTREWIEMWDRLIVVIEQAVLEKGTSAFRMGGKTCQTAKDRYEFIVAEAHGLMRARKDALILIAKGYT